MKMGLQHRFSELDLPDIKFSWYQKVPSIEEKHVTRRRRYINTLRDSDMTEEFIKA
jgi:hypothetical protein